MWDQFRRFRRTRPFWGGLFTIVAGGEILLLPLSPVADLVLLGVAGVSGALIGLVLVIMGTFVWFSPANRTLAGVLTCVFSLASFVVSNLGGLVVGMVLGLIGGALTLAWTPDRKAAAVAGRRRFGRGPGPGGAAVLVLLLGVVPLLLLTAGGQALAAPAPREAALPVPPLPDPPGGDSGDDSDDDPDDDSGDDNRGAGGSLLGLPLPGAPGPLFPPVLPGLVKLLPSTLFAPFQPSVRPEGGAVASGLVGELLMDTLTVTNFRYQGMVEFPVAGGGRQRALRIVVDSTDIGNLRINIPGDDASVQVTQRPDSPNARTTRLVLDCTRVRLTIAGLLTVEFTLDFPPPPLIVIPLLAVTDVEIDYVRLATPNLLIPGLEATPTGPAGKRVGVTGSGSSGGAAAAGGSGAAPGRSLTAAQADQLTRLAALLGQPGLLRPYRQNRA